jgi:uncharacterized protein
MCNRWDAIIDKHYSDNRPLRELLLEHSRSVADRSLSIAAVHPRLGLDSRFLEEAAMLHDIGIYLTDAPSIHCHGTHPYICHGYLGAELLAGEGLPCHAFVCERHTGTGLSLDYIVAHNLPLPHRDMIPLSLEEKVICFADKFFSKSRPGHEKTVDEAVASISRHGREGVKIFLTWCGMFL